MKVEKIGEGDPEHVIMYCIHGNEPCGKLAVERIRHEDLEVQKPVKLVFANEKAFNKDVSHVDEDLNRAWNPDRRETHEKKLARKIQDEIRGKTVLDLHSSFSHPEAFGLKTEKSEIVEEQMTHLGLRQTASIESEYNDQIEGVERIAVECGYTRSQRAIENAYNAAKNFMRYNGIIEGEVNQSSPERYEIFDRVNGSGYQFTGRNFRKVEEGDVFAIRKKEELRAEEDFYPVLMSTTGYDNMVGFKARKVS